jgi:hypothetical protein
MGCLKMLESIIDNDDFYTLEPVMTSEHVSRTYDLLMEAMKGLEKYHNYGDSLDLLRCISASSRALDELHTEATELAYQRVSKDNSQECPF